MPSWNQEDSCRLGSLRTRGAFGEAARVTDQDHDVPNCVVLGVDRVLDRVAERTHRQDREDDHENDRGKLGTEEMESNGRPLILTIKLLEVRIPPLHKTEEEPQANEEEAGGQSQISNSLHVLLHDHDAPDLWRNVLHHI